MLIFRIAMESDALKRFKCPLSMAKHNLAVGFCGGGGGVVVGHFDYMICSPYGI